MMAALRSVTGPYHMVTARVNEGGIDFPSHEAFLEAIRVGFFQIKAPDTMDLSEGRAFARRFTSLSKYNQFGALDETNGFLLSELAQTVRFTLERDFWNKSHSHGKEIPNGEPNYPPAIQKLGHQMHQIGVHILQFILEKFSIPKEKWFEATGGSAYGEGSHYLLFNCYDPKNGAQKSFGVGAHKDWGHITILDAEPGLEAKIDGLWRSVYTEEGYLTVNFGYPLEKLIPQIAAAEHRVQTQVDRMRVSTVAFIDPRVGAYRTREGVGTVCDWDPETKQLVNQEPTTEFFSRLNQELYGKTKGS